MNNKVSILITTFNRANQLNNSLQRMTQLTLADQYLIIDDGSSDNTKDIVSSYNDKLPIKYIYNNNPVWSICSFARNIGIKNAIGDIIITSEPELLFVTDIVKQMLQEHTMYPNELVSAGTVYHAQEKAVFNPGFLTDPVTALKGEIVQDYQIQPRSYHPAGYCKTKNMQATFTALYEKEWLMKLGGWDEAFPGSYGFDDIELATRLRLSGINQHICAKMEVIHQFHPHLPPHIQGPMVAANDEYMKSKRLDTVTDRTDEKLIANKGKEWGIIQQ